MLLVLDHSLLIQRVNGKKIFIKSTYLSIDYSKFVKISELYKHSLIGLLAIQKLKLVENYVLNFSTVCDKVTLMREEAFWLYFWHQMWAK